MISVYTDGARNGEGWSGIGIVIHEQDRLHEYRLPIGKKNNNHEVEFEAVVQALEICNRDYPGEIISLRSDSQVVVDTIEKSFTKNKMFQPYLLQIQQLSDVFQHVFIKWIPQNNNQRADFLAKKGIYLNE